MAPEYERVAENPELKDVTFAKIDCDKHSKPCEQFKIEGYPTMLVFKKDTAEPVKYEHARKSEAMASYIKNLLRPPFTAVFSQEELTAEISKNPKAAVVYMDSPEVKAILSAAEKTKHEAPLLVVFNSEISAKAKEDEKITTPYFIQYRDGETKKNFSGEITVDSIEKFIKNSSIPMLAEIGPENYMKYVNTGLPISFFFYDNKEMREKYSSLLNEIAPLYKDKTNFVFIDAVKYKAYASALNITPNAGKDEIDWPRFVIHDVTRDSKFVLDAPEITKETMTKFMDSFVSGSIKPNFKSQPIPSENNGPVKTVVYETFKEIVMDKSKDVLIDLYAPWCGMCKRIEPYYEKLAVLLKDHPGIALTKMDATLNDLPSDIPFKLEHYPTLKLFKANTNEIVDCDSFLDIKAMHDFLKANAVNNKFNIESEISKFMSEETAKNQQQASKDAVPEEQGGEDDEDHDEL